MKNIKTLFLMVFISTKAAAQSASTVDEIVNLAQNSSCSNYSWRDRGQAPVGYIEGMALSYGRSLCRTLDSKALEAPASVMDAANSHDADTDAISHYLGIFDDLNMPVEQSGVDTLRAIYTLAIGEGMRESSGNYCEGPAPGSDTAASAEAGLFQSSYDTYSASPELAAIYEEYQQNPDACFTDVFAVGNTCSGHSVVGKGAGARWQKFTRGCPAFAAEYAMVTFRTHMQTYGPLIRYEAEVNSDCYNMLTQVEQVIASNSNSCAELSIEDQSN